jgi:hypothetical protein
MVEIEIKISMLDFNSLSSALIDKLNSIFNGHELNNSLVNSFILNKRYFIKKLVTILNNNYIIIIVSKTIFRFNRQNNNFQTGSDNNNTYTGCKFDSMCFVESITYHKIVQNSEMFMLRHLKN